MFRFLCFVTAALAVSLCSPHFAALAEPPHPTPGASGKSGSPSRPVGPPTLKVEWHTDYGEAMDIAAAQGKLLVVLFHDHGQESLDAQLDSGPLGSPEVVERLQSAVAARLPADATIQSEEGRLELLKHSAFADLRGRPGLAVIDLTSPDSQNYGYVTKTLPLPEGRSWTVGQVASLLGLLARKSGDLAWRTSYQEARDAADKEGRMLLILFCRPGRCALGDRFEAETLSDPEVRKKLADVVKVKLPLDAKVAVEGKPVELLTTDAFAEMKGLPGLAVMDFADKDSKYYGQVVSVFPFLGDRVYGANEMREILDLPPGSLTQRTMIYAVRVHPEHPASTKGEFNPVLAQEAESHSEYQARIGLQGHHFWETRFHRINARLPAGLMASEVCAESWPGQGLLESAIECVRCWRLSSGHWEGVRTQHRVYGYDIKRGSNGVWYATGIFGRQ